MKSTITSSPWGAVQHQSELAEGIVQVSTSSHGGIWLSPQRRREAAAKLKGVYKTFLGGFEWWEEDCDCAIVVLCFRDELPAEYIRHAERSAEGMAKAFSDEPKYKAAYELLVVGEQHATEA